MSNFTPEDIETIAWAAIETLLWATPQDTEDGSDGNGYWDSSEFPVSPIALGSMVDDVNSFIELAGADLEGMGLGQIGHDLTLTRNGHGAGFWDRGLGERGNRLSKHAKSMGGIDSVFVDSSDMIIWE